jgi:hypothetical protein
VEEVSVPTSDILTQVEVELKPHIVVDEVQQPEE